MLWLGVGALAGVAGCGASDAPPVVTVYEVKGAVLKADGKPLTGGRVYFVPNDGALTPEGTIGPDGTFSLATGRSGDGAPPGEYRVRVEPDGPSLVAAATGRNPAKGKKLPFPPKYLDEDSSGLTARVEPRANLLEPFRLR
jgi:hypothetical protein